MVADRKKRVSKKNKKSWRKHIDVSDVDNFLEDVRLEERLGVKFDEKKDEELFSLDTTGENEKTSHDKPPILFTRSLRIKEGSTPKCFALLEKRTAVPDPVIKRNRTKVPDNTRKLVKSIKRQIHVKTVKPVNEIRNIWNETDNHRDLNGLAEWLTTDTLRHTLQNTGHKTRRRLAALKAKPSPLPAVEVPHPGQSYNPSFTDHNDLLNTVVEAEVEIKKQDDHIKRVTTDMFRKIPVVEAEKAWMSEMSVGLEVSSDSEADDGNYSTANPPVVRKKKTLKQRRKIKEEREKKRLNELKKVEKKKRSDVNERMSKLEKQIIKTEERSSAYLKRKEDRRKEKETATKVLSRTSYSPQLDEFQSPCELSGSIRKLTPVGSVLLDRYNSLLKRNIIEPSQRRHVTKAKVKRFVKASHRISDDPKK